MMDTFVLRLLLSTITVSFFILLVFLIKKIFAAHISPQMHYKIWLFIAAPPIFAFFPWTFMRLDGKLEYVKNLLFSGAGRDKTAVGDHLDHAGLTQNGANSMHDLAVSVNKATPDVLVKVLIAVWLIGITVFTLLAFYAIFRIHQLKKSTSIIKDKQIIDLFDACKATVGIKKQILFRESHLVSSPITLGVAKPYILLPAGTGKTFSLSELKYVILHELCHQKSRDVLVNYMMWLLRTIYWFNPLVWYSLKKINIDRELACDASVLKQLDESGHVAYGQTIIRFATNKHDRSHQNFSTGIGGTKQQIKQRIIRIASYSQKAKFATWKNRVIIIGMGFLVLLFAPLTAVFAHSNENYSFHGENVVDENMASYFKGSKGSFVLYDSAKDQYHIHNRKMSERRVSPDSTYKIYSGLIALEEGIITPASSERDWNGKTNPFQAWNHDQNLQSAISDSVNWYFQGLDQATGQKKMQQYFASIGYGNEDFSGDLSNYWMESSLKISPIEQVQLLKAMNENELGFRDENTNAIKDALFAGEHQGSKLYGKTGTGTVNGKDINGWFIGFVEQADNTYYFAVNMQDENGKANGKCAMKIAEKILKDKHIYESQ